MLVTMIATVLQELLLSLLLVPLVLNQYQLPWATGQMLSNRPPHFISGSGDMTRFSLSENTPVDSPVYQLKGTLYYIVFIRPGKEWRKNLCFSKNDLVIFYLLLLNKNLNIFDSVLT